MKIMLTMTSKILKHCAHPPISPIFVDVSTGVRLFVCFSHKSELRHKHLPFNFLNKTATPVPAWNVQPNQNSGLWHAAKI